MWELSRTVLPSLAPYPSSCSTDLDLILLVLTGFPMMLRLPDAIASRELVLGRLLLELKKAVLTGLSEPFIQLSQMVSFLGWT